MNKMIHSYLLQRERVLAGNLFSVTVTVKLPLGAQRVKKVAFCGGARYAHQVYGMDRRHINRVEPRATVSV